MKRFLLLALLVAATARAQTHDLFPFVLPWDDASPGITDLSGWLDKPAGKNGRVIVRDGHYYAGDKRIRFLGVNLGFGANFPEKGAADKIAARMAKFGINCVRFHHMDRYPAPKGIRKAGVESTRGLDADALGRMDYLIAQLKRQGIYANLNLLVARPFKAADGLPAEIETMAWKDGNTVGFFYAPAIELQKEYARELLTHRNPHTGLTYAEDPAVAFVEIHNENGLFHSWSEDKLDKFPAVFRAELGRQWNAWRQAQGLSGDADAPLHAEWSKHSAEAQREWLRFLWDTEDRYWQGISRFLKEDLRVKAIVVGTIVGCSTPSLMARLDAVDAHEYWQYPRFPNAKWDEDDWTVPNKTMVNERGGKLTNLALRRVRGKAFNVTEYNHTAPNTFGSEAYLLLGAYAGLQDWDSIYAFAYSGRLHGWDLCRIPQYQDIDQHPTKMVTLPAAAAMFRRGDVQPAKTELFAPLDHAVEIDKLRNAKPWTLVTAGHLGVPREATLLQRIGVAIGTGTVVRSGLNSNVTQFAADTGELNWDLSQPGRGVVTLNTPRSKAVIGFGAGRPFALGDITIVPGDTRQEGRSAITATEVQPGRWLLTATGYAENTGMVWKNASKDSCGKNWGTAPSLVEGIPATITFPSAIRAWPLDARGQRRTELKIDGALRIGPAHRTLWYEVELRDSGGTPPMNSLEGRIRGLDGSIVFEGPGGTRIGVPEVIP